MYFNTTQSKEIFYTLGYKFNYYLCDFFNQYDLENLIPDIYTCIWYLYIVIMLYFIRSEYLFMKKRDKSMQNEKNLYMRICQGDLDYIKQQLKYITNKINNLTNEENEENEEKFTEFIAKITEIFDTFPIEDECDGRTNVFYSYSLEELKEKCRELNMKNLRKIKWDARYFLLDSYQSLWQLNEIKKLIKENENENENDSETESCISCPDNHPLHYSNNGCPVCDGGSDEDDNKHSE